MIETKKNPKHPTLIKNDLVFQINRNSVCILYTSFLPSFHFIYYQKCGTINIIQTKFLLKQTNKFNFIFVQLCVEIFNNR